jgi:hypothetical protein
MIVDFVRRWSEASEIGAGRFVGWLGVTGSKFYDWPEEIRGDLGAAGEQEAFSFSQVGRKSTLH